MHIVVASRNPVKIAAVCAGFAQAFAGTDCTFEEVEVPSGVPDQPRSDTETYEGARNRAQAASQALPAADAWVGIEGGIENLPQGMVAFAWVVVLHRQRQGAARSASFVLPPAVAGLVRQGVELGEADDRVFGRRDSKRQDGAVGLLTQGRISRQQLYSPAVLLALIPFLEVWDTLTDA
ncbi:MAG: inosine/xanthosine triphosphatase [Bacteroidia bacterium]